MKELIIISGKGGTGKTSITACFAALAKNAVLADCDVDAADLHLILKPQTIEKHDFTGGKIASVNTEKCIGCGVCQQVCNFDAIDFNGPSNRLIQKTFTVDPISCEGCGVCVQFCPVKAIDFEDSVNGQWFISDTRFSTLVHAKLGIAEENSGKLVSLLRKKAKQIAEENNHQLIIVDGSPGIGCPVISSISGADAVLIVTEPTMSGLHDMERVIELVKHFDIPAFVCINKYDINTDMTDTIEKTANEKGIEVTSRIPYDNDITNAQLEGLSVVEYKKSGISDTIQSLFNSILEQMNLKD